MKENDITNDSKGTFAPDVVFSNLERYGQTLVLEKKYGQRGPRHISVKQRRLDRVHWSSKRLVNRFAPVVGLRSEKVTQIAAGFHHTLLLCENGNVMAFGSGSHGQLGLGDTKSTNTPTIIPELAPKSESQHTKMHCGSFNQMHKLFNKTQRDIILKLENIKIIQLSAGQSFSAALSSDGRLFTWGYGPNGELGLGKSQIKTTRPRLLESFYRKRKNGVDGDPNMSTTGDDKSAVNMIAAGKHHMMAISEDGTVFSWGKNDYGQLGIGNRSDKGEYVPRTTKTNWSAKPKCIAAGCKHSALVTEGGDLWLWGRINVRGIEWSENPNQSQLSPKCVKYFMSKHLNGVQSGGNHIVVTGNTEKDITKENDEIKAWLLGGGKVLDKYFSDESAIDITTFVPQDEKLIHVACGPTNIALVTKRGNALIIECEQGSYYCEKMTSLPKSRVLFPSIQKHEVLSHHHRDDPLYYDDKCSKKKRRKAEKKSKRKVSLKQISELPRSRNLAISPISDRPAALLEAQPVLELKQEARDFDRIADDYIMNDDGRTETEEMHNKFRHQRGRIQSTNLQKERKDARGNIINVKWYTGQSSFFGDGEEPERAQTPGEVARSLLSKKILWEKSFKPGEKVNVSTFRTHNSLYQLENRDIETCRYERIILNKDIEKELKREQTVWGNCIPVNIAYDLKAKGRKLEDDNLVLEAKRVFYGFDLDNSGELDVLEFHQGMLDLGYSISYRHAKKIIKRIDKNKNGKIGEEEFLDYIFDREKRRQRANLLSRLLFYQRKKEQHRVTLKPYLMFVEVFMNQCVDRGIWYNLTKEVRNKLSVPAYQPSVYQGQVDFSNCGLTDEHVEALCIALKAVPIIKHLNLQGNRITADGGTSLVELLEWHDELAEYQNCAKCILCKTILHFDNIRNIVDASVRSCSCSPASRGGIPYRLPVYFLENVKISDISTLTQKMALFKIELRRRSRDFLVSCLETGENPASNRQRNGDNLKREKQAMLLATFGLENEKAFTINTYSRWYKNLLEKTIEDFDEACKEKIPQVVRQKEIRRIFMEADIDNSGGIELKEMKRCSRLLGLRLTTKEAEIAFQKLDADKSGQVTLDEFMNHVMAILPQGKQLLLGKSLQGLQYSKTDWKNFRRKVKSSSKNGVESKEQADPGPESSEDEKNTIMRLKDELSRYGLDLYRNIIEPEYYRKTKEKLRLYTIALLRQLYWKCRNVFHQNAPYEDFDKDFLKFVQSQLREYSAPFLQGEGFWSYEAEEMENSISRLRFHAERIIDYYKQLNKQVRVRGISLGFRHAVLNTENGTIWSRGLQDDGNRDRLDLWRNRMVEGIQSIEKVAI